MRKVFLSIIFFLFVIGIVRAACYDDPNLILCWDTSEGRGTIAFDSSRSKLHGTLTGGPAWVKSSIPKAFTGNIDTMTYVRMGDNSISFPGTAGINVQSANTSIFDFSGSLPYTIGFSMAIPSYPPIDANILAYTATGSEGWACRFGLNWGFIMGHVGIANTPQTVPIWTDTNPHRVLTRRLAGVVHIFVDGKLVKIVTGFGDMTTVGVPSPVGIDLVTTGSNGDVAAGKIGCVAVYNYAISTNLEQVKAFAWNEYLFWMGGGDQGRLPGTSYDLSDNLKVAKIGMLWMYRHYYQFPKKSQWFNLHPDLTRRDYLNL